MSLRSKTAKISTVVAVLCIITYIAAIGYGAYKVVTSMGERQSLAESEFSNLTNTAVSRSVDLGFLSETYRQTIRDFLNSSETLIAVIINGSGGEYGFEKQEGSNIVWINGSPRFKPTPSFSGGPLVMPLRIDGQRNVTIQAVYSYLDNAQMQIILRNILIAVLAALALALLALFLELLLNKKAARSDIGYDDIGGANSDDTRMGVVNNGAARMDDDDIDDDDDYDSGYAASPARNAPHSRAAKMGDANPLYSPRSNISWEAHTAARLASELHRAASSEQDLALLAMDWPDDVTIDAAGYSRFAEEAAVFFTTRDLVFERGESGVTAIIPDTDLEDGIARAEEFRRRIASALPRSFSGRAQLRVGLASRGGRLVNAERLLLEASSALVKAFEESDPCVIAFKSDPEKYREFIRGRAGRED